MVSRFSLETDLLQHFTNLKSQLLPTWRTKDLYQQWGTFFRWWVSKPSQFKLTFNIPWKIFWSWKPGGKTHLWCSEVGAATKLCFRWAVFKNVIDAFLAKRALWVFCYKPRAISVHRGPHWSQSHMAQGIQGPLCDTLAARTWITEPEASTLTSRDTPMGFL